MAGSDEVGRGSVVAGRYLLVDGPFRGGAGEVWQALDQADAGHRHVALKRTRYESPGPEVLRQLEREYEILAALDHPNIVPLYEVLEVIPDQPSAGYWLVMEWLPAGSLAAMLDDAKKGKYQLPDAIQAARYGMQIAQALAAVHAENMVHGDVKPGNVFGAADGRVKLGDFGTALRLDGTTITHPLGFTPDYAAPEVKHGATARPESDVYSLGCTLYALVMGKPPVPTGENTSIQRWLASHGSVGKLRRLGPLKDTVAAMLRTDPDDRPDATEAVGLLERAIARGERTRRAWWRWAAALATLAALALVAVVLWPPDRPPERPPAPTTPVPIIGKHATADPCSLTDPGALSRFGEVELDSDYGNYERCDVLVFRDGAVVDVEIGFRTDVSEDVPEPTEDEGPIRIVELPKESDGCYRALLLPDKTDPEASAWVSVEPEEGSAPLCDIADVATRHAAKTLARAAAEHKSLPRRSLPKESLMWQDSCELLDPAALDAVPAIDANDPSPDFGDWACSWHSNSSDDYVDLRFDRRSPLTADDGRLTRLDGRIASVAPEGDGEDTCTVLVEHRTYQDPEEGDPGVEMLRLFVYGSRPVDWLCATATELATSAATELPTL